MQPTLNTAKDSKDIMLDLLKFPTDWWLYDPVNKNNTEPFSEGGGGGNWVHIWETLQCFKAAISLFAMADSIKLSHLHYHHPTLQGAPLKDKVYYINISDKTKNTWSPYQHTVVTSELFCPVLVFKKG